MKILLILVLIIFIFTCLILGISPLILSSRVSREEEKRVICDDEELNQKVSVAFIRGKTYTELCKLAFTDQLTGVYNRNMLEELRSELDEQEYFVTFIDIDNLKIINDKFGHKTGDEALKYISDILINISRYVFRLGGDEFLVLHKNPIDIHFIQASYGTIHKNSSMSLSEAMCEADEMMYKDKRKNKGEDNNEN